MFVIFVPGSHGRDGLLEKRGSGLPSFLPLIFYGLRFVINVLGIYFNIGQHGCSPLVERKYSIKGHLDHLLIILLGQNPLNILRAMFVDKLYVFWNQQSFRKMVDDGADGNSGALASLFTVTTKKAAPQYDYTSVPSRFDLFFGSYIILSY